MLAAWQPVSKTSTQLTNGLYFTDDHNAIYSVLHAGLAVGLLGQMAQLSVLFASGSNFRVAIVCMNFLVILHMLLRWCCDAVP